MLVVVVVAVAGILAISHILIPLASRRREGKARHTLSLPDPCCSCRGRGEGEWWERAPWIDIHLVCKQVWVLAS